MQIDPLQSSEFPSIDWLYVRFGPSVDYEFIAKEYVHDLHQDALETYEIRPAGNTYGAGVHHIELATGVRRSITYESDFFNMQSDPRQDLVVFAQKDDLIG